MDNIDVKEAQAQRMKCGECPLWNNDTLFCQHPKHTYPLNNWDENNDPFDTCPLKEQPIKIQFISQ